MNTKFNNLDQFSLFSHGYPVVIDHNWPKPKKIVIKCGWMKKKFELGFEGITNTVFAVVLLQGHVSSKRSGPYVNQNN